MNLYNSDEPLKQNYVIKWPTKEDFLSSSQRFIQANCGDYESEHI